MNIVITGGAGFIGSNAAEYFQKKGDDVIVVDNLSRKGSAENLQRVKALSKGPAIRFESLDIRNGEGMKAFFKQHKNTDAVLHLAGQVAVTTSVVNPREDFEINALGTFNVLEGLRENNLKPIVLFSSTNKVYGGLHHAKTVEDEKRYRFVDHAGGIDEDTVLDFHSPYGCSKGAADQYVRDYSRIYNIPSVVFRQSCIYGQNQLGIEDQGWVAWFSIAALFGRPLTIYGNGKQVRDVLFIDDLLQLYDLAIQKRDQSAGKIFNAGGGPGFTLSLLELMTILEEYLGKPVPHTFSDWRPGDQPMYVSNIQKLEKELGWKPKTSPRDGINTLLTWIKGNEALIRKAVFSDEPVSLSR